MQVPQKEGRCELSVPKALAKLDNQQWADISQLVRVYLAQNLADLGDQRIRVEIGPFNASVLKMFGQLSKGLASGRNPQLRCWERLMESCLERIVGGRASGEGDRVEWVDRDSKIQELMKNPGRGLRVLGTISEEALEEMAESVRGLREFGLQQSVLFSGEMDESKQEKLLTKLVGLRSERGLGRRASAFSKRESSNTMGKKVGLRHSGELSEDMENTKENIKTGTENEVKKAVLKNGNTEKRRRVYRDVAGDLKKVRKEMARKKRERRRQSQQKKLFCKNADEADLIRRLSPRRRSPNYSVRKSGVQRRGKACKEGAKSRKNATKRNLQKSSKNDLDMNHIKKDEFASEKKSNLTSNRLDSRKKRFIGKENMGKENVHTRNLKQGVYALVDFSRVKPRVRVRPQFKFSEKSRFDIIALEGPLDARDSSTRRVIFDF